MVHRIKHYKVKIDIHMFWIRRKNPLHKDIEAFALSRQQYFSTTNQVKYLYDFVNTTGIQKYEDITEEDIYTYCRSLDIIIVRPSERVQIVQALFLFMRYKKVTLGRMNKRGRGRPQKIKRNEDIIALRQQKFTYDDIATHYKLNKRTVYDIVNRDLK